MERFIQIVKGDIERLSKAFKNIEQLHIINPNDNNILSLDPNYVLELLSASCSVDKTELYSGERMDLFKELFLKGLSNFTISYIKGTLIGNKENTLILNLYTSLLTKSLLGNRDLEELIKESLSMWRNSLKTLEMPVKFYIELHGLMCKKTVEISANCNIERIDYLYEISDRIFRSNLSFYSFFSIEKNLKIKFKEYRDYEFFTNDYQKRWDEIIPWIFTLYLSGYIFLYNEIEIITPWWIWNPLQSLSFPLEPWSIIKPCSNHDFSFFGISHFKEKDISRIRNYYSLIKCSKILDNKDFTLIISRYFRMFDTSSIQDRILNAFILLESIFTSQSPGEVSYKLRLNVALFLSSNNTEFSDIYEFIKTFYGIRSKIAHGNEWLSSLINRKTNKIKNKYLKFFNVEIQENPGLLCVEIFKTLKNYLDRALLKIMCWQLTHDNESFWKKTENGLFFLKNRMVN